MSSVTEGAAALLPHILQIMRSIDAHGDVEAGKLALRLFRVQAEKVYGRRAVQVAYEVARVRHRRAVEAHIEALRIKAFLASLEQEGGHGTRTQS